jgi:type VI protein secretion system component Hcp
MKKIFHFFILVSGMFFCTASFSQNIFLKIVSRAGVTLNGGSMVIHHQNEINAMAYSDGLEGCTTLVIGGGGGACKINHTNFSFSMHRSLSAIQLKKEMLIGNPLKTVDMTMSQNNGEGPEQVVYRVHMENVNIVSISDGGEDSDGQTFNVELLPRKIAWQVLTYPNTGGGAEKFSYGWDFSTYSVFNYTFPL